MTSLYDILKANRLGMDSDPWVAMLGEAWKASEEDFKEYTGLVPYTFIANGQPLLDWYIKGNMSHTGTPTPSNPVSVNGVGERTKNLYNIATVVENTFIKASTTGTPLGSEISNSEWSCSDYIEVLPNTEYTVNYPKYMFATSAGLVFYTSKSVSSAIEGVTTGTQGSKTYTFTTPSNCNYVRFSWSNQNGNETMFVTGGTAKPYEPYGYKIPISSANTTTPVYLGEVESTRQIKKLVLSSSQNWQLQSINSHGIANFYITLTNDFLNNSSVISNYFTRQTTTIADTTTEGALIALSTNTVTVYIRINSQTASTAQEFKNWLDGLSEEVAIWYVLAEPTTGIVNEPIRKIGDYADTLTAVQAGVEIPTDRGRNTIDIDTDVKPSEFYMKWKER